MSQDDREFESKQLEEKETRRLILFIEAKECEIKNLKQQIKDAKIKLESMPASIEKERAGQWIRFEEARRMFLSMHLRRRRERQSYVAKFANGRTEGDSNDWFGEEKQMLEERHARLSAFFDVIQNHDLARLCQYYLFEQATLEELDCLEREIDRVKQRLVCSDSDSFTFLLDDNSTTIVYEIKEKQTNSFLEIEICHNDLKVISFDFYQPWRTRVECASSSMVPDDTLWISKGSEYRLKALKPFEENLVLSIQCEEDLQVVSDYCDLALEETKEWLESNNVAVNTSEVKLPYEEVRMRETGLRLCSFLYNGEAPFRGLSCTIEPEDDDVCPYRLRTLCGHVHFHALIFALVVRSCNWDSRGFDMPKKPKLFIDQIDQIDQIGK